MNLVKSLVIVLFVSVNSFAGDQVYDSSGSFFVELPQDEYCNTGYGAQVIHGTIIHPDKDFLLYKTIKVDSPQNFIDKWPTVNPNGWVTLKNYKGSVRTDRLSLEELAELWQKNGVFDLLGKCNIDRKEYSSACCKDFLIEQGIITAESIANGHDQ